MEFKRELPGARVVKEMYPVSEAAAARKKENDEEIQKIFRGESDKFVLVIGPCSADREDAVLDYISRLAGLRDRVKDKIVIIPRIYTNKPRTTGDGYKGMLHQPDPTGAPDMLKGLTSIRRLHIRAIEESGFACADEMLYPENYKYLDDLLGYVAVGARSVEDQQHRLTASAIECPVGMKNPTGGDLSVMMNGILAAQHQHDFIYRGWEGHSYGNPFAHAILRGYVNRQGVSHPNYHYEDLLYLSDLYKKWELKNPAVVVDCNHANSGKKPFEQARILKEVLHSCRYNPKVKKLVKGFMVESYIEDGNQPVDGGVYGKSITDACIGWKKTEKLIYDMAELL